ncbi:unnamed protein product [Microthlaspi erraticum]|uniref:F-box domain-containing protein n=1 Tax=Microthlaspi erraticum TaxID=1685480 RepID=A0A6D2K4N9_9BRAS|nr:unnamed protein product [Microthlaspi erraticum]
MRKPSKSASPLTSRPSFSSLPYDVALNCLARSSRTQYPTLSLVSKRFRSLLASSDLEATRSLVGKPETCLYVWLNLNNKPCWFLLSETPNQQRKLIPIPSFPYKHSDTSTVLSVGSEIYIIGGGFGKHKRSRRVVVLDCKSHQWRELPKMHVPRNEAAVDVTEEGKIRVVGGCSSRYVNSDKSGEVYDPKTQTWEPLDVGVEASLVSSRLRCEGGHKPWKRVVGLKGKTTNHLVSVENHVGGMRKTVLWWLESGPKTQIWCAEVSLVPCPSGKIERSTEWSENVFTFQGCESDSCFVLHSTLVTHEH